MGIPKRLFPACLLFVLLGPAPAWSAEVRFQSSTQYLWYTDPFTDKNEKDLVQHLKFAAPRIDNTGRFTAAGYGRVFRQFGSTGDRALGDSEDVVGRLYFLYINYALPEERGDIRMGRQFVSVGAGSGTVDGVRLEVRKLGPVTISAFGGYDVRFAETADATKSGNLLLGLSAGGSFFTGNNVEVSFLRKYDRSDIIREMAGLHLDQRAFGKVKGYADLRYDLMHEAYAEFLAGVKAFPFARTITLTAEYYSSYPTFDADTIYTAFAVTRYREFLGRADWIVNPELALYGSYTRADYDGPAADIGTVGVRARPKKVEGLGINASLDLRHGYPGNLTGFRIFADYAYKKALLAGGVSYDDFQRDSMAEGFKAKKYWAGGFCRIRENISAKLRVEDSVTRRYRHEYQGRASLDLSF